MDVEKLKRVEEIFHAALKVSPNERETFLNKICGADENLRREVESLLDFEKDSDVFLDKNPESFVAEMFAENEDAAHLINRRISHYQIKKLIGRGGMGEVYLAEDFTLERHVALKILSARLTANADRLNRFVREAKAASALNHPNIITIYEVGKFDDLNFIATEFIEGETLRERKIRGEIPFAENLSIIIQAADALCAAHAAGIVHRDIKPENIMVRRDGYVKVLDFGLAKLVQNRNGNPDSEAKTRVLERTTPGLIMGTVAYMSPEQTRGSRTIDERTDIWSLGVVIYEMFAGKTPFEGETASDLIASILKTEPLPLAQIFPECPPELNRILAKALKKDREERYSTSEELVSDLKNLRKELDFSSNPAIKTLQNKPTEIINRQTTNTQSVPHFSSFTIRAVVLSAVLTAGVLWWFYAGSRTTPAVAVDAPKTVEIFNWASTPGESESVGSFSPDGKMIAFASTKNGGKNIWIKQTNSGEAVRITKEEFDGDQPIWSPNGDEIAFFSTRGNQFSLWRVPALGGAAKLVSPIDDGSSRLKFWSSRNQIYYESERELYALDVNSGQSRQITDFNGRNVSDQSIGISPDEKSVAYLTVDGEQWNLWTERLDDQKTVKIFTGASEIKNIVWHPDNRRIFFSALVDKTFQIFVINADDSSPKQVTNNEKDSFVLNTSVDGTKILYGSAKEESDVWAVNLQEKKEFNVVSGIDSELWANVSPDAKSIVYQTVKNLSQGNNLFGGRIFTKRLESDNEPVEIASSGHLPVWSPDGQKIAFIELSGKTQQISTINLSRGGEKKTAADNIIPISYSVLPYDRIQSSDFSWSPDSRKIAYVSRKNGLNNIWVTDIENLNDGQLTANDETPLNFYNPLWSADGKRIAFTSKTGNRAGKPTFSVWLIDTESKNLKTLTRQKTFFRLISWMPNGDLMTASTEGSEFSASTTEVSIRRINLETGEERETAKLKDAYLSNIALSPDGKNVAFAAHRDNRDDIWLMPASGGTARKVTNNNDSRIYFSSLAWSPDENTIFFGKQSRYSLLSMMTNFK